MGDALTVSVSETGEREFQVRSALVWVAELISLFGIVAFTAAVLFNNALFDHWGIEFLQVATATDVIMSGLHILVTFIPLLFWNFVGFLSGLIFVLAWIGHSKWQRVGVVLLALAALITAVNFVIRSTMSQADAHSITQAVIMGMILYPAAVLVEKVVYSGRAPGWFVQWIPVLSAASLMVPHIVQSVLIDLESEARYGLNGGRAYVVGPVIRNCVNPLLLWGGDKAVVVKCPNQKIMVLRDFENLEIEVRSRRARVFGPTRH